MPTMRRPRLTWVSLEGTPGGVCWLAQKDASASWSRFMVVSSRVGLPLGSLLEYRDGRDRFEVQVCGCFCDEPVRGR